MRTKLSACVAMLLFGVTTAAVAGRGADVSGTWEVAATGESHGEMTATLTLKQEGRKVTGTLAAHGNQHAVSGEFENGTLRLTIEPESHEPATMTGELKDDGTLSGSASGPMGDMHWTATRAKRL